MTHQQDYQYYEKNRPRQPKNKNKGNGNTPSFIDDLEDFVEKSIVIIQAIAKSSFVLGMTIAAMFVDVILGSLALSVAFQNDITLDGIVIGGGLVGMMIEIFTSGLQVYIMTSWHEINQQIEWYERLLIYVLILGDTFIDLTTTGYLLYGENVLTINFLDKPFGYYVILLIVGLMCAFSETLVVSLTERVGWKRK